MESSPKFLAVVGYHESDTCPHCGSSGRHVFEFLCDDGQVRSAMRGCLKKFQGGFASPESRLLQEAFQRAKKGNLASWWKEMIDAATQLRVDKNVDAFIAGIRSAEMKRQSWLRKNGFKR